MSDTPNPFLPDSPKIGEPENTETETVSVEAALALTPEEVKDQIFADAQNTFERVPIGVEREHLLEAIRNAYRDAQVVLIESTPAGRLQSLAKTSLEESCMWAVKALSRA